MSLQRIFDEATKVYRWAWWSERLDRYVWAD